MHKSVKLETPCEFINVQPLNPLISKCQIKVCYVGEQPNRNRSIITKEVARQMANSLPGSPIVGYFNEGNGDFEEHNRTIDISNGKFKIKDATRPYGFVDLNAKCWFQKYMDDDCVEREYLVTEGYLWTGQYPECQRCVEGEGNNQSMELDKDRIDAYWTKDNKGKPQFFIINEAIISKLCILGEDCEPCFEGSNITGAVQFSLEENFQQELYSMMKELKELLQEKGGAQVFTTYAVEIGDALWSSLYSYIEKKYPSTEGYCSMYRIEGVYEEAGQKFAVLQSREDMKYYRLNFALDEASGFTATEDVVEVTKTYTPSENPQFAADAVEAFEAEYAKKKKEEEEEGKEDKSDNPNPEDKTGEEDSSKGEDDKKDDEDKKEDNEEDEDDEKKKKKAKYSLEEIPEYTELLEKFSALQNDFDTLKSEKEALEAQIAPLKEFKAQAEKTDKENMIKSFYMLSDEDKKDVVDNIDTYSLDEIEAKLSIICVRNKVSFTLEDDKDSQQQQEDPTVYNLGGNDFGGESTPAWVKAALDVAKEMK